MEALWNGLAKRGKFRPVIIFPSDGPFCTLMEKFNFPSEIVRSFQPSKSRPLETLAYFRGFLELLHRNQIAILHANDMTSARSTLFPCALKRIPVICHVRFYQSEEFCRWVFRKMPKPDAFVFNSREMRAAVGPFLSEACPHRPQYVVYNAVDISSYTYAPIRKPVKRVGIIANLQKVKGHEDFLMMAAILLKRGHGLAFDIIGADYRREGRLEELEEFATLHGVREFVRFHGFVSDVPALLKEIDIVVCASHEEPFGRCLIESMAAGRPVVATQVGGIPEVVEDGKSGFLVPPRSPESLADAVEKLIINPVVLEDVRKCARKRVEKLFSLEAHAEGISRIYGDLLQKG